jgi:predicted lactoylglutathione lyase
MEKFDQMDRLLMEARDHFQQFLNGKDIAGTRARKALISLRNLAQEVRQEIQHVRRERKAAPPSNP